MGSWDPEQRRTEVSHDVSLGCRVRCLDQENRCTVLRSPASSSIQLG